MTPTLSPHELASINAGRIERGLPPLNPQLRGVQASASPPQSSAFAAGIAHQRQRALFGDRLRVAFARVCR